MKQLGPLRYETHLLHGFVGLLLVLCGYYGKLLVLVSSRWGLRDPDLEGNLEESLMKNHPNRDS